MSASPRRKGSGSAAFAAHLVTLAFLLSACAGGAGEVATATPSATTASAGPSAMPADALVWSEPHAIPDGGVVLDLVRWRSGYVAVGEAPRGDRRVGAVYTSTDGAQLLRAFDVDATGPALVRVVALEHRLLATANETPYGARVWTSGDGHAWRRDDTLFLPNEAILGIASRDGVVVAVAADAAGVTRIHQSSGGAAWRVASLPPRAIVRGVAALADGFIAFGRSGREDVASGGVGSPGVGRPAAWSSRYGERWTELPVEGVEAPGAQIGALYRVTDRFLAIGSDTLDTAISARAPLLWASDDARDWRLIGSPAHWGHAVVVSGRLIVFTYAVRGDLAAWATQDGARWTPLVLAGDVAHIPALPGAVGRSGWLDRIFPGPDGIVVVGQMGGRPTSWFAEVRPRGAGTTPTPTMVVGVPPTCAPRPSSAHAPSVEIIVRFRPFDRAHMRGAIPEPGALRSFLRDHDLDLVETWEGVGAYLVGVRGDSLRTLAELRGDERVHDAEIASEPICPL